MTAGVAPKFHLRVPVRFEGDKPEFVFADARNKVVFAGQYLFLNGWGEEQGPKGMIDLR
ncbi:MAG: hypothetical protein V2A70_03895 [Candidatus Omnitrophota bacterium]